MRSLSLLLGTALALGLTVPAAAEPEPSAGQAAPLDPAGSPDALEPSTGLPAEIEAALAEDEPTMDAATEGAMPPSSSAMPAPPEEAMPAPEAGAAADAEPMAATEGDAPAAPAASDASAWGADEVASSSPSRASRIVLGPIGVDENGRQGRIHTVASGDTLWDISEAYLGTPWVWPSVWHENTGIANPHRIDPGDLIWITSTEMRRVTAEEAEGMVAAGESVEAEESMAAAPAFEELAPEESMALEAGEALEVPAAMEQEAVSVPLRSAPAPAASGRTIRVSSREGMSFVSSETIAAASSIVSSPVPRTWLAMADHVHLGLGEGEVEVGDRYTIYRDAEPVEDIDGGLLGYHVEVLGWAEVVEVHGDTSTGLIRLSISEMQIGDRIVPREEPTLEVSLRSAPADLEGSVVFLPDSRTVMGAVDYVYINRGTIHGVEVGSLIEVYDPGAVAPDTVRSTNVRTPDLPFADAVVVSVQPDSCVAFVTSSRSEIEVGNAVRASLGDVAARE